MDKRAKFMDAAPALLPPSNSPIDIVAASSAELVSHVSKSKGKRRKKKVVKKKDYTRTETPELLHAISTVLETKPYLIQDAAALKSVLQLYFCDLNPTYSIVKQVATRLVEKQRAERKAEAAVRTQVITEDCATLRTAIKSILSESVPIDSPTLKTRLLAPPHFIQIKWKLLEEVRAAMGPLAETTAPKLARSDSSTHKLRNARSVSGCEHCFVFHRFFKISIVSNLFSVFPKMLFIIFPPYTTRHALAGWIGPR